MITKFEINNYYQFSNSINELYASGLYSGILITIYNDENGTNILTNNDGILLNKKKIINIKKRDPYIDNKTNLNVPPYIELFFADTTMNILIDNNTNLWYTLEGIPFSHRSF